MLLRQQDLPDVDILVAGHHGSGYSTTDELLDAVTPETVLISLSEDNNYGHPDPQLLQRLATGRVEDLSVSEPNLEEVFLHYYQKGAEEV